jgi:Divergent InlB B-repeat domain
LTDISCSLAACVSVDADGQAVYSADPAARAPAWTATTIDPDTALTSVSCVSGGICAVGDDEEGVLDTADAGTTQPEWARQIVPYKTVYAISCSSLVFCGAAAEGCTPHICGGRGFLTASELTARLPPWNGFGGPENGGLRTLACPSRSLCVGVDLFGTIWSTVDPTAEESTWSSDGVTTAASAAVSCASQSLCVAAGDAGHLLISRDPQVVPSTWSEYTVDTPNQITAVSCVSSELCVGVDNAGNAIVSTDPGSPTPTWTVKDIDGDTELRAVSCASVSLCVATDSAGDDVVGEATGEVSVVLAGSGAGRVSAPSLACPGACANTYPLAAAVTLTAAADTGSTFTGWSGACSGTGSCQLEVAAANDVIADFAASEPPAGGQTAGAQTAGAGAAEPQTAGADNNGSGNASARRSSTSHPTNRPTPAPIARFSAVFTTRASLRGHTIGLLTGLPVLSGLPPRATVVVRCRHRCARPLDLVRHTGTHHTIALVFGQPLVLTPTTTIEISVTAPHLTGRYVDYTFKRAADTAIPYTTQHGCLTNTGAHQPCP